MTMFDIIGILFLFIANIFPEQFALQLPRTLSIEIVELLHYLMYTTNRFCFGVRVHCNRRRRRQRRISENEEESQEIP